MKKPLTTIAAIALGGYLFATVMVSGAGMFWGRSNAQTVVSPPVTVAEQTTASADSVLVDAALSQQPATEPQATQPIGPDKIESAPTEKPIPPPSVSAQPAPAPATSQALEASSTPSTTNPTTVPTPTKPAAPAAVQVPSNACIVTVFGNTYNVSALRSTHSGGDLFVCGTDMSTVYKSQHGTDTQLIAKYKV